MTRRRASIAALSLSVVLPCSVLSSAAAAPPVPDFNSRPVVHPMGSGAGDFDGDGRQDTVTTAPNQATLPGQTQASCVIDFKLATGKSVQRTVTVAHDPTDSPMPSCPNVLERVDFDGDGRDSVFLGRYDATHSPKQKKGVIIGLQGDQFEVDLPYRYYEDRVIFPDLDGDRRSDVVYMGENTPANLRITMTPHDKPLPDLSKADYPGYLMSFTIGDFDKKSPGLELVGGPSVYDTGDVPFTLAPGLHIFRKGKPEMLIKSPNGLRHNGYSYVDVNGDKCQDVKAYWWDGSPSIHYGDCKVGFRYDAKPAQARNDRVQMQERVFEVADINVLRNDLNAVGADVRIVTPPKVGKAEVLANGRIRYDRRGKGLTPDSLTYSVSKNGKVTTATVVIDVRK